MFTMKLNNRTSTKVNTELVDNRSIDFYVKSRHWLSNPNKSFFKLFGQVVESENRHQISPPSKVYDKVKDKVILIQQFYVDKIPHRHTENKFCLKQNVNNKFIDKIILLNEEIYTNEQLGLKTQSSKIKQINIKTRLTYKDVFYYINNLNLKGYIVLANTDIFLDDTIERVKQTGLSQERKVFCQLRHEYNGEKQLSSCTLHLNRPDTQDAWIWHTNSIVTPKQQEMFDYRMGKNGCDNKTVYVFSILGFACHNEPTIIKIYHNHTSQIRNYLNDGKIPGPYYSIHPFVSNMPPPNNLNTFDIVRENQGLHNYVLGKLEKNLVFIIPRIASVENKMAMYGNYFNNQNKDILNKIRAWAPTMKKNAGILLNSEAAAAKYSKLYLSAFNKCERYFSWEPWNNYVKHIPDSFDFILANFPKPKFDTLALDIFHSIPREPWTRALRGKRVLIISPFKESFESKVHLREKIYGIDLFPDCELSFIKPPQTQADNPSRPFDVELNDFMQRLYNIKDTFDIALCSCGGYGNLVCAGLFDMGKSAIYVGGVLQMYFGVYGQRWLRDRPDVFKLYRNDTWSRPKPSERPQGFASIEGGCYW